MLSRINSKIKTICSRLLVNHTGYWNGHPHRVNSGSQDSEADQNNRVWIISRELYQESCKHYPISDRKELKKVLELSLSDGAIYSVGEGDEDGHWVMEWCYNHPEALPMGVAHIPESALYASAMKPGKVGLWSTPTNNLFVHAGKNHLSSTPKSKLVSSLEMFAASVGVAPSNISSVPFEFDESLLRANLTPFLRLAVKFANFSLVKVEPLFLAKWLVAPIASIWGVYLLLFSWYLHSTLENIRTENEAQQSAVQEALATQAIVQAKVDYLAFARELTEDSGISSDIWPLLIPLYEMNDVKFRRIQILDGDLFILGEAQRATDVLRAVSESEGVEATFYRPVAKRNRYELFNIQIKFTENSQL